MPATSANLSNDGHILLTCIRAEIDEGSMEVPLLPEVASKAIALTQDPDSDAAALARLIQSDPTLAAHVMRTANSAAYTPNASMVSLQQAIARLGMNLITDIAVAASINTRMFHAPGHEQRINTIWKHALTSALWGKEIARSCRMNVETAFLCGLLHSIGQPVILQTACDIAVNNKLQLIPEDIDQLLQQLHIEAGACVLNYWGMPTIICEALEYFNNYSDAPLASGPATITNAAALFATHSLNPDQFTEEQLMQAEVLADLNLYQEDIQNLLDKRDIIISGLEAMSA